MKAFGLFIEKKKNEQHNNQKQKAKNKMSFSSSANSQYFFIKISWIGPWVSRID